MMWLLTLNNYASYVVPVRQYRILPFGFLQCLLHNKPSCHLLTIRIVNPLVRDLHPLENLAHLNFVIFSKFVYLNFSTTLRWVCPAHAGHTQQFGKMAGSVLNSTAVLRLNFCAKLNICASIPATSPSSKTLVAT